MRQESTIESKSNCREKCKWKSKFSSPMEIKSLITACDVHHHHVSEQPTVYCLINFKERANERECKSARREKLCAKSAVPDDSRMGSDLKGYRTRTRRQVNVDVSLSDD